MKKSTLLISTCCLLGLISTACGGPADEILPPEREQAPATEGQIEANPGQAQSQGTSVGDKNIQANQTELGTPTIGGANAQATDENSPTSARAAESVSGPSAQSGTVSPLTTTPSCGGRIDFYRLLDSRGHTYCFANPGNASGYWTDITRVCPGNNHGQARYLYGSSSIWSPPRGPTSNYNTCYTFNSPVSVIEVHLD